MRRTVGSEIRSFRNSVAVTGIPRVIRETHRYLQPMLARHNVDLLPVATSERAENVTESVDPYVTSDVLGFLESVGPEDVDLLLLLHPSTAINFRRITSVRQQRPLPVIAMVNDLLPLHHPEWFPPHGERNYRVLIQQILHVADHVIVPSHAVMNDLSRLGWKIRPKIHINKLGTAFPQRPPRPPRRETIDVLYVSTIEPRKGHALLLDAFDLLRSQDAAVRLTLVGRIGWEVDPLLERIRRHPERGSNLHWIVGANDETVAELLSTCTVAVMPSEGEGFGFFIEEALSAGTMVVASDIPVFRERTYKNLLFFDNTPEGLANAIINAANQTPVTLRLGDVRTMKDFSGDLFDLILDASTKLN